MKALIHYKDMPTRTVELSLPPSLTMDDDIIIDLTSGSAEASTSKDIFELEMPSKIRMNKAAIAEMEALHGYGIGMVKDMVMAAVRTTIDELNKRLEEKGLQECKVTYEEVCKFLCP